MAESKQKRVRKQETKTFLVRIVGSTKPTMVASTTKKAAIEAIMNIREATHAEIRQSGQEDWDIIDLTHPPEQTSLVREVGPLKSAAA